MARLVRAIHVFTATLERKAWMTRIKRVMTILFSQIVTTSASYYPACTAFARRAFTSPSTL